MSEYCENSLSRDYILLVRFIISMIVNFKYFHEKILNISVNESKNVCISVNMHSQELSFEYVTAPVVYITSTLSICGFRGCVTSSRKFFQKVGNPIIVGRHAKNDLQKASFQVRLQRSSKYYFLGVNIGKIVCQEIIYYW